MSSSKISLKKSSSPAKDTSPFLKKKRLRIENSLGEITKKFIEAINSSSKNDNKDVIDLNDIMKKLKHIKKRRIYDITNVLEGIGYISKPEKNKIILKNKDILDDKNLNIQNQTNSSECINMHSKEVDEIISLENEKLMINNSIRNLKNKFNELKKDLNTRKLAYLTYEDFVNICDNDKKLLVVKTPVDTIIKFPEKEKLNFSGMDNHMILKSMKEPIDIYLVSKEKMNNKLNENAEISNFTLKPGLHNGYYSNCCSNVNSKLSLHHLQSSNFKIPKSDQE